MCLLIYHKIYILLKYSIKVIFLISMCYFLYSYNDDRYIYNIIFTFQIFFFDLAINLIINKNFRWIDLIILKKNFKYL